MCNEARKIENQTEFIKKIFKKGKYSIDIDDSNFSYGVDDMVMYLCFNGKNWKVEYSPRKDKYELYDQNIAVNKSRKQKYHFQKEFSRLAVMRDYIFTSHRVYRGMNKTDKMFSKIDKK